MMKLLTRNEMRELDRKSIEDIGIPGLILMENAGRGASVFFGQLLLESKAKSVDFNDLEKSQNALSGFKILIINGQGNNGGDGFVIARHLHNWGADVKVIYLTKQIVESFNQPLGDAEINHKIASAMGIKIVQVTNESELEKCDFLGFDAIIDGIFGTGLQREITGLQKCAIQKMNNAKGLKFAIDVPSGLNCDTGEILGICFKADATATFGAKKIGMTLNNVEVFTGKVRIIDISAPKMFYE